MTLPRTIMALAFAIGFVRSAWRGQWPDFAIFCGLLVAIVTEDLTYV